MIAEEEWNRLLERTAPIISLGIGILSLSIGTMAAMRAGPLGRRAYSQDGTYLIDVRHGQWNDIRDFIQPYNPDVLAIFSQYGPDYWSLFDFVCRNIDYRRDTGEFWQFPSETLKGWGDCEDSSILFTSLLRNFTNGHVALGSYQGYGHAWCQLNGQILETTYTRARLVPDPEDYYPYVLFNDQEVVELWPGALGEIFSIRRDEVTKLNLMAEAVGNEVPPECPSCWPFLIAGLVTGGILGTGFAMILQKGE